MSDGFRQTHDAVRGGGGDPAPVGRHLPSRRDGQRPVYGGTKKFQNDPHWKNLILFYEYFHGENGAGLGASHQTGWTGTIAPLMDFFGRLDAKLVLEAQREKLTTRLVRAQVAGEEPETVPEPAEPAVVK